MSAPAPPEIFVQCLKNVPDPRSSKGVSHPFHTLLGLLANVTTPTGIARWAKIHFTQLKQFLRFRTKGTPSGVTFSVGVHEKMFENRSFFAFENLVLLCL